MNKITIIGNLTKDPQQFSTQSGVPYCQFGVAVNRPYTDDGGNRPCDFFEVVAWRQLSDRCCKFLSIGNKVGISGSMQMRNYEDRDGNKRIAWTLVANEVEFLTPKADSSRQSTSDVPQNFTPVDNDDDLPF